MENLLIKDGLGDEIILGQVLAEGGQPPLPVENVSPQQTGHACGAVDANSVGTQAVACLHGAKVHLQQPASLASEHFSGTQITKCELSCNMYYSSMQ